jgi:signal transduction histidine kinase
MMRDDQNLNIHQRVVEKKEAYQRYNFERIQEEALSTFFDLAQEHSSIEALYQICVAVPKVFFDVESNIYIVNPKSFRAEKVYSSENGMATTNDQSVSPIEVSEESYETENSWVFSIHGNLALKPWLRIYGQTSVLGMFEIFPKDRIDNKGHFFFSKYTNRIGYNLHLKLLMKQNMEHIKFINQLVSDIEHNVISPNLYYKLAIRRMTKSLNNYETILNKIRDTGLFCQGRDDPICKFLKSIHLEVSETNEKFGDELHALSKHYEHSSLFLETLFRRDHFEQGTYVLRRQPCNFRTEILDPLLERYRPIFEKKNIVINDNLEDIPDEEITLVVDKGLVSQVFDNIFSNAAKYAKEVENETGTRVKFVAYNRRILKNYFGEGTHGVRFSFFTTGQPLSESDVRNLFEEGFRSSMVGSEQGTGHGLHFVRSVVEIHGGQVGCFPQSYGNEFYFTLPVKEAVEWAANK